MLKIMKTVFRVLVVVLAGYGLITQNFSYAPLTLLSMGAFTLVLGLSKFKQNRRGTGLNLMFASAFGFVVVLVMLLMG